jgi:hypothetical protein
MTDVEKCAHPACRCQVPRDGRFGKYCSENCREKAGMNELTCQCGHPGCAGS